ncbi:MAG: polysaccharide ABC transporter ATP-binding protein [Candidatus Saccharimonadaceae bacterium]
MNTSEEVAISVNNVTKSFKIPLEGSSGIKQKLINQIKGRRGYRNFTPLNDISFQIKKGDFFGIVGRNGSGKSTLLKTIAGIYTPNSGSVQVNGTLVPFIELGVGFNPELTGKENIYLNGALLGFNRSEIGAMYKDIVDFAELHDFMEERLKNYSSGMQVRLAFSIAIKAQGDILLLDEVLAVGDAAFQQKCTDYFEEIKNSDKTVILVTHSMESVERFCNKAVLIENGLVKVLGNPDEVAKQYTLDNLNAETTNVTNKSENLTLNKEIKSLAVKLRSDKMTSSKSNLEFDVEYALNEDIEVDLGISILYQNLSIIEHNTTKLKIDNSVGKKHTLRYSFPLENLNSGRYEITLAIFEKSEFKLIGFTPKPTAFVVENIRDDSVGGILSKTGEWRVLS